MIFTKGILRMLLIAISGISIICVLYFIFRGESYKTNLAASKRENYSVKSKLSELSEMVEILSAELTSALNYRLQASKDGSNQSDVAVYAALLIHALPSVVSSSIHQQKTSHESFTDFVSVNGGGSIPELEAFLATQPEEMLKAWQAKDALSYIRLCRMLLDAMNM